MILIGDVRQKLKDLPDCSVDCVVTSPPYWGLRDYGTASWDGGDSSCDHQGKPMATKANINRNCGTGNDVKNATAREFYKDICGRCGAVRVDNQLGLEPTPDEYVANMVAVFREVRRVMRDDGTLWLNLGDSYGGSGKGRNGDGTMGVLNSRKQRSNTGSHDGAIPSTKRGFNERYFGKEFASDKQGADDGHVDRTSLVYDVKPKDLVGIPWRVAFALQADGWYLRQDIIWAKPNPMPESVTDRCTKSHEYLFLLAKSAKYYFDNEAIKEPASTPPATRNKNEEGYDPSYPNGDRFSPGDRIYGADGKRNKRDVWTVTTKPFKGAHFATFPPQLIEPCILAGCPEGGTVLDPFFGAGTTGLVAQRHNRRWIGCELNPEYAEIARKRIEAESNMFTEQSVIVII